MNINEFCKELRLPFMCENHKILIDEAVKTGQPYDEFLHHLLENEYLLKQSNSIKRKIKEAQFPQKLYISDFDKTVYNEKFIAKFSEMETLEFINERQNIILLGATGAGKTFYATALGILACQQGKRVLFVSVADLIIKLKETMSLNQISSFKRKFSTFDLVIIDELGYYSFGKEIAELFFNILSCREKRGSIIITTNLNFDEWTGPLGDPKLASALISRICRQAHIIELEREIDGRMQDTLDWMKSRHK